MSKPVIIAGPCMAESRELVEECALFLSQMSTSLDFDLVFKASFDKANRSASTSYRGPGLAVAMNWFADLKAKFHFPVTTDIHESTQAAQAAEVCDVLQIPAFLCRQTDLIVAAAQTKAIVSVKKGQFLSPDAAKNIIEKIESVRSPSNAWLIERGFTFGYSDLIVDMRSFPVLHNFGVPVIFDVTHSTQRPSGGTVTGGNRTMAPILARAACATGYVDGLFLEVHPNPAMAKSDAGTQLDFDQARSLLTQCVPMLQQNWREKDHIFRV